MGSGGQPEGRGGRLLRAGHDPVHQRAASLDPAVAGRFAVGFAPRNWFAEAETRVAARQDRTGPFETPTDGYAVFDLSAGIRITVGGRLNVITVRGENLGNTEYRSHLSRVKEIMPEAGRSVSVTYRVVF